MLEYDPDKVTVHVTIPGTPLTGEQFERLKAALADAVVDAIGLEILRNREIRVVTSTVFPPLPPRPEPPSGKKG